MPSRVLVNVKSDNPWNGLAEFLAHGNWSIIIIYYYDLPLVLSSLSIQQYPKYICIVNSQSKYICQKKELFSSS